MLKKIIIALAIASFIVALQGFIFNESDDHSKSKVNWVSFGEAVQLQKKNPKPIMVDVYTTWCGPCKMMSARTFENDVIAAYLNKNFYPVKFNAETFDSVSFNGVTFKNRNIRDAQRPVHDFAASILDNKLVYPSIVFLNEEIKRIQIITGFIEAEEFEKIINFFGSGAYKVKKWDEYEKTFTSQIK